jgi:hypothetical protein
MASRVRTYLGLSAAGTGAAAYYLLSDGGDDAIARSRVNSVLPGLPLDRRPPSAPAVLAPAPTPGTAAEAAARKASKASAKAASIASEVAISAGAARAGDVASAVDQSDSALRYGHEKTALVLDTAATSPASKVCHSCSGPRLWFFADKLGLTPRLKRRFTPHPDPVVQDPVIQHTSSH